MRQKRIKRIGVCVVGETLLLAKAKSSKNFKRIRIDSPRVFIYNHLD